MERSLPDLARGLRRGEVTARDLLREAQASLDSLGAYKTLTPAVAEQGAAAADAAFREGRDLGLFQGIPVAVKDIYGVPGAPIFAGTSRELPERFRTPGPLVRCLLDESAVIVGKTHTVEFAFGALGLNNHWPTPRNPWDAKHARAPGGSSSGSGIALCQGSAIVALGTDTAGSVRIPASLTGNAGYKPTIGRWSTAGIVPLSPYLDTPGLLTRTVEDLAAAVAEMDRSFGIPVAPARVERLRIGVPERFFFDDCDAGIGEGVMEALAELERAGHRLLPVDLPQAAHAFEIFASGGTSGAELLAFLTHELPDWIAQLDPNVGRRMQAAAEISAAEFLGRKMRLDSLARDARKCFERIDVIATPTTVESPPRLDSLATWEDYRAKNLRMVRNTSIANLLQLNALTMPVALDAIRMPVGLQLMCDRGRDDLLLAAGLAIEKALGSAHARLGRLA